MARKFKRIIKYAGYIILSNTIYGTIVFFSFTLLVGYSLLLAYFVNLMLIILGLLIDEHTLKMYKSEKLISQLKELKQAKDEKNFNINFRLIEWVTDSFVSFKTTLYLFYVFMLLFTQVINSYPDLVSEKLGNFIHANEYTILILVAVDMLINQFTKDRKKIKKISEEFKKSFKENEE